MASYCCTAVNRTESRKYVSTVHITYLGITLELLVELVDKSWVGPIGAGLRSKLFNMAVLNAIVCRLSQISRIPAEDLITITSRSEMS